MIQQKHDIEYFFVCKNYTFARSKYVIVSHHIMVMETKHVDAAKNINMIHVTCKKKTVIVLSWHAIDKTIEASRLAQGYLCLT